MDYIDPMCIPDTFAERLESVEDLGGVFRFTFTADQNGDRIVVSRIVIKSCSVSGCLDMTCSALRRSAEPDDREHALPH
tara:strand:+ start:1694 stop:1930 length:237 start_codon:yes stop_codon:yes gene_type:complete